MRLPLLASAFAIVALFAVTDASAAGQGCRGNCGHQAGEQHPWRDHDHPFMHRMAEWRREHQQGQHDGQHQGQHQGQAQGAGQTASAATGTNHQTPGWSSGSSGSATGPRGNTDSRTSSTTCSDGTCSHTSEFTAPNGHTTTTDDTATHTGPGQYTYNDKTTGSNGYGVDRSGGESCGDGSCTATHTVTVITPSGSTP